MLYFKVVINTQNNELEELDSGGVQLSDEEKGRELEINGITGFKVDCGPS